MSMRVFENINLVCNNKYKNAAKEFFIKTTLTPVFEVKLNKFSK